MSALRYLVTLHPVYNERVLKTTHLNLDTDDDAMLRSTLESLVSELKGTLRLDLSQYRIRVRSISKSGAPSSIRCWCSVDSSGRTVVKR